jgi:hypothetical protein
MSKILANKKITILSGVLFAYQVVLTSMVVFGLVRISIGLVQGEFEHVTFGMLD